MTMEQMKPVLEDKGTTIRMKMAGWTGVLSTLSHLIPVTIFGYKPVEGLKDNSCQVPHWGYMLMDHYIKYSDGRLKC